MKIPVFHDDQHGTAIVAAAAVLNGFVGKDISRPDGRRARAAALACLNLQVNLDSIAETSSSPTARGSSTKAARNRWTRTRSVTHRTQRGRSRNINGADIFGLSPAVCDREMVVAVNLILAMANPEPGSAPSSPRIAQSARAGRTEPG
jgi:malate dehydrogenase (oxaloacetate-decarboxylating)(NADP+)